jgi:hypothetical protein
MMPARKHLLNLCILLKSNAGLVTTIHLHCLNNTVLEQFDTHLHNPHDLITNILITYNSRCEGIILCVIDGIKTVSDIDAVV